MHAGSVQRNVAATRAVELHSQHGMMEVQHESQKLMGERRRHGKQRKQAARSNDVSGALSALRWWRQTRVDNAISRRETGKHAV